MAYRESDHMAMDAVPAAGITIDRKIPLWGILGVCATIIGQAALVWSGQREQAVEMRHQAEQIKALALEVKGLGAQMATKDGKDIEQDLRINELSRRVLVIEGERVRR